MDAESLWGQLVEPYRDAAQRLGFRSLDRTVGEITSEALPHVAAMMDVEPGTWNCVDHLLDDRGVFLDLDGVIVLGPTPALGRRHGFDSARFTTYFDDTGKLASVFTLGQPTDGAGIAAQLQGHISAAVETFSRAFRKGLFGFLVPSGSDLQAALRTRPPMDEGALGIVTMNSPEQLEAVLRSHRERCAQQAGEVLIPGSGALEVRWDWERQILSADDE